MFLEGNAMAGEGFTPCSLSELPCSPCVLSSEKRAHLVNGRQSGQTKQDESMFRSMTLSGALKGLHSFAMSGPRVLQIITLQPTKGWNPSRTNLRFKRLLARAEVELAEPDAIQRREAVRLPQGGCGQRSRVI
jgi:hypothetical protein